MSEWWDLGPQYVDHWRGYFPYGAADADKRLVRLLRRTRPIDQCWIWQGGRNSAGYGWINRKIYGQMVAHRAVYQMAVGELLSDMHIHHMCGNRLCLRPDHLRQVTPKEHVQYDLERRAWAGR